MSNNSIPVTPFEDIALMMSGGGYRAAAFHLGSMSYLKKITFQKKSLLERVKVLSTISGGTFPGVLYSHAIHENRTFENFYKDLYDFMDNEDLIKLALQKLEDPAAWKNTHKYRSLINAFALVYDDKLFGESQKKHFGMLWDCDTHLEEVIFNATEFDHGLAFRFQKTIEDKGIIGNYYLSVPLEQAKNIRLADIIAASSCFPAGFEPISFPNDFVQNKDHILECYHRKPDYGDEENSYPADTSELIKIGLMDGGIIDNQGIESIMVSEQRRENSKKIGKSLDLLIVSDVAGPYMNPFTFSDPEDLTFKSFSLKSIASSKNFLYKLTIATIFFIALLIAMLTNEIEAPVWLEYLIFAVVIINLVTALIGWFVKLYFGRIFYSSLDKFFHQYFPPLFNLPVKVIEPMIKNRFSSMILMVSEVFMKQIRRLVYDKIYENKKWDNKRISNQIYALGKIKTGERKEKYQKSIEDEKEGRKTKANYPAEMINVSEKLIEISDNASSMATTLWFSPQDKGKDDKLVSLVTTGQFTMCFNLLRYILELRSDGEAYKQHPQFRELENLYAILQKDWQHFNEDPHWLFNKYKDLPDNP